MDYMYGQLYKQIKEIGYKGRNSETTIVTVDQKTKTIRVDVKILSPEQLPKDEGNYVLLVEIDENGKHTLKWVPTQSTLDRIKELEDKTYKLTYNKDTDTSTFDSNVTINKALNVEGNATFNNKVTILNTPVDATDATNKDYVEDSIKSHFTSLNIENSTGNSSLRQKYTVNGGDYGAVASGENAAAFGGKRYNKLTDDSRTPTSAEGNQSFAAGASSHAYGDYAIAMAKDNKSYQAASFTVGGGNRTGRTEAEFNDFYWDSVNNVGLHGGSKDANGNIIDAYGDTYAESYSFGGTFGEVNINRGRDSIVGGIGNKVDALQSVVAGDRNVSITGAKHIVAGFNNTVAGVNNTVNGDSNTVAGPDNIVGGYKNSVNGLANTINGANNTAEGDYNLIEGQANITASRSSTIVGYANAIGYTRDDNLSNAQKTILEVRDEFVAGAGNTASHGNGGLIGLGLKTGKNEQVAIGVANEGKSNTVFEVGNGSYTQDASGAIHITNRKNAFEVLTDGRAKVQTTPKDNDDVVRFEELKTTESKLNENIIKDPNKTYIVFNGSEVALNATIEASVDWGDGSNETIDGKRGHVYNDNVTYHLISITNITEFESGIITPQSGVIRIKLSDKIKGITNTDNYPSLIRIDFPDYLHAIGGSCLAWSTSLQEIRLGYSIQSIDSNAFFGCTNLSKVYIKTITPPVAGISIFGNAPIKKIVVPKESIEAYKTADGWKDWSDKIVYEVDSSDVDLKLNKIPVNTFGSNKVVYGWEPTNSTATAGNVTSYKLSSDTSGNSIAYRDSNGKLQASAGATADDVATFGQLESTSNALQANIDKKIDLVDDDTTIALKNNSTISYISSATAGTIMQRDSNGRVEVEDGINNKDAVNRSQLDTKLDLTGGTLTGDLTIQDANVEITKTADGKGNLTVGGNLRVNGTTTTVDAETLSVKDNLIVTNSGNTELVNLSGLAIKTGNKDADENAIAYGILYDPATSADSVKLGLGSINKTTNEFTFKIATDANPVATRDDSTKLTANHLLVWNSDKHTLMDANNLVDSVTPASLGLTNFVLDGGEITA